MWGDESKSLTTSGFKAAIRKWRAVNAALPLCPLQLNSIYWHSKMQLPARIASSLHPVIFPSYAVTVFETRLNFRTSARKMSDRTTLLDAHEKRNCGQRHFSIVLWHSFSSAIFCTGRNGAEMRRVSCSLWLILRLSLENVKSTADFWSSSSFCNSSTTLPFFFFLLPQSWVEIKQHCTVSFRVQ